VESSSSSYPEELMVSIDLTERKRDKKYMIKIPSRTSLESWEYCKEVLEMPMKHRKIDDICMI
jgi:hypothetical protein